MKKVIASLAIIAACGMSACSGQSKPLTHDQSIIAAQLEKAPPRTILIFNDKMPSKWGIVCSTDLRGHIRIAAAGYGGVWSCTSPEADNHAIVPYDLAPGIDRMVEPGDPYYEGTVQALMFDMMRAPGGNHR
jgi:hypothetical protein